MPGVKSEGGTAVKNKLVSSVMDAVVQMKKDGVCENIIEAIKNEKVIYNSKF